MAEEIAIHTVQDTILENGVTIDTNGGWGADGAGTLFGNDPTKVQWSTTHVCKQMATSVVKSGLCKRARVQLSSAIGAANPFSLDVVRHRARDADGQRHHHNIIKIAFDCRLASLCHPRRSVTSCTKRWPTSTTLGERR